MPAPKMPPWTTQTRNAVGAIGRAVTALATAQPVLAPQESTPTVVGTALRAEICLKCPLSTPTDAPVVKRRCTACGCFLGAKIALATESCPKGRW